MFRTEVNEALQVNNNGLQDKGLLFFREQDHWSNIPCQFHSNAFLWQHKELAPNVNQLIASFIEEVLLLKMSAQFNSMIRATVYILAQAPYLTANQ